MAFQKSKPTHVLAFSVKKPNGDGYVKGPTINLFLGTGKVIYKGTEKPEYLKKLKEFIDKVDANELPLSVSVFKSEFSGEKKDSGFGSKKKIDFDL